MKCQLCGQPIETSDDAPICVVCVRSGRAFGFDDVDTLRINGKPWIYHPAAIRLFATLFPDVVRVIR